MKLITRNGKLLSRGGKAIGRAEPIVVQWDYEGVMTVGSGFGAIYGWFDGDFGSMTPSVGIQVDGYDPIDQIYSAQNTLRVGTSINVQAANFIEIDGVEYEITGVQTDIGTNPFIDKVGEEVTIKLR